MSSEPVAVSSFSTEYVDWEDHVHDGIQTPRNPALVWSQVGVYGAYEGPPNELRSCSLARRQSIWFVHLSCIGRLVDTSVTLPRPTAGHVFPLSLSLSLSFCPGACIDFTQHSFKPSSTKNSYAAQTQLSREPDCNRITCTLPFSIKRIVRVSHVDFSLTAAFGWSESVTPSPNCITVVD